MQTTVSPLQGIPLALPCRLRKFFVVCDSYWYLLTRTTQMACSNFVSPPSLVPHAPASLHRFIFLPSPSLLSCTLQSTLSQASLISLYSIQSQILLERPFTYNITITRRKKCHALRLSACMLGRYPILRRCFACLRLFECVNGVGFVAHVKSPRTVAKSLTLPLTPVRYQSTPLPYVPCCMSNREMDHSSANLLEWDTGSLLSSMIPLMVHAFSGSRSLVSRLPLLSFTLADQTTLSQATSTAVS